MDKVEIKNKIYNGEPIECGKDKYESKVRSTIQDIAGDFVDSGDGMRAQIALMEVKRLDNKLNHEPT